MPKNKNGNKQKRLAKKITRDSSPANPTVETVEDDEFDSRKVKANVMKHLADMYTDAKKDGGYTSQNMRFALGDLLHDLDMAGYRESDYSDIQGFFHKGIDVKTDKKINMGMLKKAYKQAKNLTESKKIKEDPNAFMTKVGRGLSNALRKAGGAEPVDYNQNDKIKKHGNYDLEVNPNDLSDIGVDQTKNWPTRFNHHEIGTDWSDTNITKQGAWKLDDLSNQTADSFGVDRQIFKKMRDYPDDIPKDNKFHSDPERRAKRQRQYDAYFHMHPDMIDGYSFNADNPYIQDYKKRKEWENQPQRESMLSQVVREADEKHTKYALIRYPDTAISYIKNDGNGWEHIYDRSYGYKGPVDKDDMQYASHIEKEKIPSRMFKEAEQGSTEYYRDLDKGQLNHTKSMLMKTAGQLNVAIEQRYKFSKEMMGTGDRVGTGDLQNMLDTLNQLIDGWEESTKIYGK